MRSRQRISKWGRGVYQSQHGTFFAKLIRRGKKAGHKPVYKRSRSFKTPEAAREVLKEWLQAGI
jgi:hypothetical protein